MAFAFLPVYTHLTWLRFVTLATAAVLATVRRFAARRWALLVLVDLYFPSGVCCAAGRGHKIPAQRMCRLIRALLARLPGRSFVFAGKSGCGTHEVTRFGHRRRLTLVSNSYAGVTFAPPRRTPAKADHE